MQSSPPELACSITGLHGTGGILQDVLRLLLASPTDANGEEQ